MVKRILIVMLLMAGCGPEKRGPAPTEAPTVPADTTPESQPAPAPATNELSPLGINLTTSGIMSQSPELAFKDLFKQSAPWISNNGQPFAGTTADGYPLLNPGQFARTQMAWSLEGHYPGGVYTCRYDGQGTIAFSGDAAILSQGPGEILVAVTPGLTVNGVRLNITTTDPADPVRNIRLLMPGFETEDPEHPFHPDFLARWEKFKTIRFMNWQRTNLSTVEEWSQRTPATWTTQADLQAGVAIEYMIRLANELHADPWFCMPHRASDDFVLQFATLVHDTLDPTLKVYLEYANEAWNPAFATEPYAEQQGLALGLSPDPYTAGRRFVAQRTVQMNAIWESVFGSTDRLVRTMSIFTPFPQAGADELDWNDTYLSLDALAIGPYFRLNSSMSDVAAITAMTIPQVLDSCMANIDVIMAQVAEHAAVAAARGLELIAYEGGQHLVGLGAAATDPAVLALFSAANQDPGMGAVYAYYMDQWKAAGGRLFLHFASMQRGGPMGLLEWHDQTSSPKYDTLLQFIADNPAWW